MIKKILVFIAFIAVLLVMPLQETAYADSSRVLLVYDDKEEMKVISDLIKACGMTPVPVDSVEYTGCRAAQGCFAVRQKAGVPGR